MNRAPTRIDEPRVAALIDREQRRFLKSHPRSAQAWARGLDRYLHGGPSRGMSRWAGGFPPYVANAKGARLRDIDGRDYVDFCLGDSAALCGHGAEAVAAAVSRQIARGASTLLPTEDSLLVGDELTRRFGLPLWTLTTSAADAHRAAILGARTITGRDKALVFSGSRHSRVEPARVVEFNDVEAVRAALSHGDVACVLSEPVMTGLAMIPPLPGFHVALRDATREAGALLIIDETYTISCGIGGYSRDHKLEPDMLTLGEAIAGGVPAGALGVTQAVAERMWAVAPGRSPRDRPDAHPGMGGGLAGNALTVAAMRAVLAEVLTESAYRGMIAHASSLASGVHDIIKRQGLSWCVTKIGARCQIMFGPEPPNDGAQASAMRRRGLETWLHAYYLNEGVLAAPSRTMLLVCPATSEADISAHTQVFGRFVEMAIAEGAIAP